MNVHENARMTPRGREGMVRRVLGGESVEAVALAYELSQRTVRKWVARFAAEGLGGLLDRSSRPHRLARMTPLEVAARIEGLRRQRRTMLAIAGEVGVSLATVSRLLRARGLSRLAALEPKVPIVRYERAAPGELIHIDTKKLGRIVRPGHRVTGRPQDTVDGAGWEYLHLAVDDHSRLAYTELLPDERPVCATAFLLRALAWFAEQGVAVERVMTDNGPAYVSKLWRRACRALELRHIRTRPYTPKTNGKAERFVQTSLREWAYVRTYQNSAERHAQLAPWTAYYNHQRPHSGIGRVPPISRLKQNNVLRCDT
jgi:transposase InsO family protein